MSDGWAGEDFSSIFGGAERSADISPGRSDLTPTELDYYTGGVPPLPDATPQMDGSLKRQVVQSTQADLNDQSNIVDDGVQWGGNDILQKVVQGAGSIADTVTSLGSVVMSSYRKLQGAANPTPPAVPQTAGVSLFGVLVLVGGLWLASRYL